MRVQTELLLFIFLTLINSNKRLDDDAIGSHQQEFRS